MDRESLINEINEAFKELEITQSATRRDELMEEIDADLIVLGKVDNGYKCS
jgi:hypothetical protein